MATKRTDAFDVFTSDKDRRDADIKALKAMSPHSTLKGMGRAVAPLHGAAQGTVPPPVSIQDAEAILLAAETQITHNPLHAQDPYVEELVNADDLIELIEESGLLVLDSDQVPDDAIEVSSSFLIEDLDGFPAGLHTAATPDYSASNEENEEIEEITSNHLAYVETRGEIVEVIRPRLPSVEEVPLLNRHNLYNDSAEYSDGIPRLSTQPRGLSSKTLRVPAPRAEGQARRWLWNAAVGLVFIAGIGAGVAFAMHSSAKSTPATSPAAVDVAAAAAPLATAPEAEEVAEPVVAPLGDTESEVAALEAVEPTVVPLDVDSLDLEAAVADLQAEEAAAENEVEVAAEASAAEESGPVVTALPMEPTSEEVAEPAPAKRASAPGAAKSSAKRESRPRPSVKAAESAEPTKSATKSAIINAGSTLPSADPGVLMLAAKPPCEIRIDGKTTGLTTPQRVLKLAPGNHRIMLTNQEHQIKDSFKVSIVSGKKTRIVRDNTSKIK